MRETVVVSEEIFSPFLVCDRLGVSSLAFRLRRFVPIAVSFRFVVAIQSSPSILV